MKKQEGNLPEPFKAKVAIKALKERESLAELSKHFIVHPNIISKWKREFLQNSSHVFGQQSKETEKEVDLHTQVPLTTFRR